MGVVPVAAPYAYARPLGLPVAAPVAAYARPLGLPVAASVGAVDEYDPNPQYSYAYDIQDALTGKLYYLNLVHDWLYLPYVHIMQPEYVKKTG